MLRLRILWSCLGLYSAAIAFLLFVAGWSALRECEGMGCLALKLMWIYWGLANAVVAPFALILVLLSRRDGLLGRLARYAGIAQLLAILAVGVYLAVIYPEPWNL